MKIFWFALLPTILAGQCTYVFSPASVSVPAAPDSTGSFTVATQSGCARTAVSSNPDWLTISFGGTGTGNGTVGYRVDSNTTASIRTGTISIGATRFTVTQAAANCTFDLSATGARVGVAAGTGTFNIATRCSWTAQSSVAWLRVASGASGTGDGTIGYAYDANTGPDLRTGTISVGGRLFTVTQNGQGCTVRLGSAAITIPAEGGSGLVAVTSTCAWTATRTQIWITLTGATTGSANGTVPYRVDANTGARRFGTINVQDQAFTITQEPAELPVITGIANAASNLPGAVSPGEIVVLYGNRFGVSPIATYELSPDNAFITSSLAATRVLFDDVPAPMIYSFTNQVSAIVPYSVAGRQRTQVVMEFDGKRSAAFGVDVATTAPALFTQDSTGSGAAAVLNEDNTLNTVANPAVRGSILQIFATGEGQTDPPGVDGKLLTGLPLPEIIEQVLVFIGGAVAEVVYKGGAPFAVAGLAQINARVPLAAPRGDAVPIQLRIGVRNSQGSVTVAIQ